MVCPLGCSVLSIRYSRRLTSKNGGSKAGPYIQYTYLPMLVYLHLAFWLLGFLVEWNVEAAKHQRKAVSREKPGPILTTGGAAARASCASQRPPSLKSFTGLGFWNLVLEISSSWMTFRIVSPLALAQTHKRTLKDQHDWALVFWRPGALLGED